MGIKLDICPFCGGEARLESERECYGHGEYHYANYVLCRKCGARGPKVDDFDFSDDDLRKAMAAVMWNNRLLLRSDTSDHQEI